MNFSGQTQNQGGFLQGNDQRQISEELARQIDSMDDESMIFGDDRDDFVFSRRDYLAMKNFSSNSVPENDLFKAENVGDNESVINRLEKVLLPDASSETESIAFNRFILDCNHLLLRKKGKEKGYESVDFEASVFFSVILHRVIKKLVSKSIKEAGENNRKMIETCDVEDAIAILKEDDLIDMKNRN